MAETVTQIPSIQPAELKRELDEGRELFFLDVRNADEFKDWKIEGRKPVRFVNVPYFQFVEDEAGTLAQVTPELPRDRPITVVCAKGGGSLYVAELLRDRGYHVRHLEGGMHAWSELYNAVPVLPPDRGLTLFQVARVAKGCLSYLVGSQGQAMVVDPNRHADYYLDLANQHGLKITAAVDSHLHADHISGARRRWWTAAGCPAPCRWCGPRRPWKGWRPANW